MPISHAVIRIDHAKARILRFDTGHLEVQKVKAHSHYTRQHGSTVRSEHEFFAEVCADVQDVDELLVTGPHTAITDFISYIEKHRAALLPRLIGSQATDHESDAQLVAFARDRFLKHERMTGKASLD